jgi:hypothetical protein
MSGTMTLSGSVIKKRFGAGSKSDRMAVFLKTTEGEYVLRRKGGLAYSDPELDALVGKRLRCTGTLAGYTFLMTEWEEIN